MAFQSFRGYLIGLVLLAFAGSIGMTLVILACALHNIWWPFFVVLFYVLAPLPTMIAKRHMSSTDGSNSCLESAIFLTMGFVLSSFALPIVLARTEAIQPSSSYLTISGNVVVYLTMFGYFTTFDAEDSDYSMW